MRRMFKKIQRAGPGALPRVFAIYNFHRKLSNISDANNEQFVQ
jgi:hypothetical protein